MQTPSPPEAPPKLPSFRQFSLIVWQAWHVSHPYARPAESGLPGSLVWVVQSVRASQSNMLVSDGNAPNNKHQPWQHDVHLRRGITLSQCIHKDEKPPTDHDPRQHLAIHWHRRLLRSLVFQDWLRFVVRRLRLHSWKATTRAIAQQASRSSSPSPPKPPSFRQYSLIVRQAWHLRHAYARPCRK